MLRVEESEALDRAKNMLFTNVAHQLFTPLNLISGPLDDVLIDMKPGQERDALLLARRHVRRLSRLVNILMDVSRLEANRLKASFRCVNLGKITRDIAGLFSKTAQAANLEFRLKCDVTPHDVYLDREMWEKMLFNLVGNACDYTKQGSITVSVSYTDTQAVFLVKDSGIGIPAVELEHMFSEGTGMALSFTRVSASLLV
jgi:signal transduction histidine kinase